MAPAGNRGIPVIQAYRSQSHRSPVYIDDLKDFSASESKLNRVLKETRGAMQDIGLHWNQKKCSVVHVKRGAQVLEESGMRMDETTTIMALGEGKHYKFLGVLENVRQDERPVSYTHLTLPTKRIV